MFKGKDRFWFVSLNFSTIIGHLLREDTTHNCAKMFRFVLVSLMGRNVKDVKDVNLKLNYLNVMLNVKDDANNCLF